MSTEEYLCWNDTSVADIFLRLITKRKILLNVDFNIDDYDENHLTLDEFNYDYKTLEGYIEWKRINKPIQKFSFYNFTPHSMASFLQLITYDTNNKDELIKLWGNEMIRGNNVTYLPNVNDKSSFLLSRL
jgi:hypothetical protein